MVAWFIGLGLYISFTIIRKNREKIEALLQDGKKTAQVLRGDEIHEIPLLEVRKAGCYPGSERRHDHCRRHYQRRRLVH